jgi:hypothetical protein
MKSNAKDLSKEQEVVLYEQLRPLIAGQTEANLRRAMKFLAPADEERQRVNESFNIDDANAVIVDCHGVLVKAGDIQKLNPHQTDKTNKKLNDNVSEFMLTHPYLANDPHETLSL